MRGVGYRRQRALILALLASLLLWNLPWGGLILYPFKLMATWLHEMSHGLVMLGSGAGFEYLEIFQDTSGLAQARYAVSPVARACIHSAGYMGTALIGAFLMSVGQTRQGARTVLGALGFALGLSSLLWIKNDFGQMAALVGAASFLACALVPNETLAILVLNFVAVQACINALLDIRVLFRSDMVINGKSVGSSDAHNMADASFGSPSLWAALWLLWSCLCFYVALRFIRKRQMQAEERMIRRNADSQAIPK